jgi:hypothetical protein
MAQVVEYLPSKHKTLSPNHSTEREREREGERERERKGGREREQAK